MLRLSALLTPLVLFGACSHAPRLASEPEGLVMPSSVHARAREEARVPDLAVARAKDERRDPDGDDEAPGAPAAPAATHEPGTQDEPGATYEPGADAEHGRASFYGSEVIGHRTASGDRYD